MSFLSTHALTQQLHGLGQPLILGHLAEVFDDALLILSIGLPLRLSLCPQPLLLLPSMFLLPFGLRLIIGFRLDAVDGEEDLGETLLATLLELEFKALHLGELLVFRFHSILRVK